MWMIISSSFLFIVLRSWQWSLLQCFWQVSKRSPSHMMGAVEREAGKDLSSVHPGKYFYQLEYLLGWFSNLCCVVIKYLRLATLCKGLYGSQFFYLDGTNGIALSFWWGIPGYFALHWLRKLGLGRAVNTIEMIHVTFNSLFWRALLLMKITFYDGVWLFISVF